MSHNASMIPKISVTSYHSTSTKYNNILEDNISYLQNIRESIQIGPTSACTSIGQTLLGRKSNHGSSIIFGSAIPICLSLPDLSGPQPPESTAQPLATAGWYNGGFGGAARRKSWAAVEERHFDRIVNKCDSVSSLDSQSRADTSHAHNKRRSNSTAGTIVDGSGTGGANSTHSLNDAKFFVSSIIYSTRNKFEFDGQQHKLNELSMMHCRLPLQKSISTPSIPPACEHTKEDTTVAVARHFSDTDEENQDERSLLCVKEKTSEVDHPEKRRKRGSLFFRKKKDKSKTKATTPKHCDDCSNASGSCAEHTYETKTCMKPIQITKSSSKKSSDNSHQPRPGESMKDLTDGMAHHHHHGDHVNFPDNAALLHYEFLNEAHLMAHHLDDDAVLGIGRETEHDTWSPRVGADIVKQLTAKQIKRQEHIYELIITEKRHCQILCLMQKVFVESLQQHFGALKIDGLFPRLPDLMRLHKGFLKQLRLKQDTHPIVDSIADILLEFFSGDAAQQLKSAYGEFCSNHQTAVDKFKCFQNTDVRFAMWHNHKQTNPLLKRKGIPECMLFVVQRLTKYPILIEDQLKLCKDNGPEREKLLRANAQIKDILVDVNAQVALMDNNNRLVKIYALIDYRSTTTFGGEKFSKSSIKLFNHKLKFEGVATLMQGRTKEQTVNVIVLSDCLFFLQKKEKEKEKEKEKLQFFTPEGKAGVVSLQKLLIRENATDPRGIYLISSLSTMPEMYELKVQQPKDKNVWIQAIRAAVSSCPLNLGGTVGGQTANGAALTEEQQQDECRDAARRELIAKMRMNDLEHAILLDQKIAMQANYLRELGITLPGGGSEHAAGNAETYLAQFGSYRQLLGRDEATINCDTVDLTRRAVNTVQEIGTLIGTLYRTATGVELPLRVASLTVGEALGGGRKAGGSGGGGGSSVGTEFVTYKHPSRAETFSGYDEKMSKLISPWRDAVVSSLANSISSNISSSGHNSHHESTTSVASSASTPATVGTGSSNSPARSSATASSGQATADGTASPLSQTAFGASGNNVSATASSLDTVTMRHVATSGRGTVPATAQDHHNALLVAHHLHALLAVAHQLLSTVAALQHELRDHPKSLYRHDVQLEELRNLQDKFQEEKTVWLRQRDAQEAELAERLAEERVQQQRRHEEQEDLREQREQLYRKLEKLERLEATAAAAMPAVGVDMTGGGGALGSSSGGGEMMGGAGVVDGIATHAQLQQYHQQHVEAFGTGGTERRSNKERMSSHSKSGPIFSNTSKTGTLASVKQTLPLKLSSSKNEKGKNHSAFSPTTPIAAQSITQLLPLKLADRKGNPTTPLSSTGPSPSNHTRTGSSPAIVQQHASSPGITSPTLSTAPHSYVPVAASRYDDRSRASRRSDTALLPMRLASMSSASSSAASTPTGRPASVQYAGSSASASSSSSQRHLQSRTPATTVSATTISGAQTPSTAAANPQQQHQMQNQQEEIYF